MEWACARSVSGSAVSAAQYRSRAHPGKAQGFWTRCRQKTEKEAVMASNNHNNNNVSILIVDDHEVVRNGIRSYLEALTQFNVIGEAASGEEALKLVSEHIPDIVLLDLIMPGMDGVETTRRIKQISPRTDRKS